MCGSTNLCDVWKKALWEWYSFVPSYSEVSVHKTILLTWAEFSLSSHLTSKSSECGLSLPNLMLLWTENIGLLFKCACLSCNVKSLRCSSHFWAVKVKRNHNLISRSMKSVDFSGNILRDLASKCYSSYTW